MEIRQVRAKRTYNTCAAVTARAAVRERTCVHFLLPFCIISLPSTSSLLVLTTASSPNLCHLAGLTHVPYSHAPPRRQAGLIQQVIWSERPRCSASSPHAASSIATMATAVRALSTCSSSSSSSYAFSSFSSSSSSSYPSGLDDDLAAVNETLPDGWSAHHSDEGVFYHNESSGKVRRHLSLLQLLFSLFSNLLQQHFFWTSLLTTL